MLYLSAFVSVCLSIHPFLMITCIFFLFNTHLIIKKTKNKKQITVKTLAAECINPEGKQAVCCNE